MQLISITIVYLVKVKNCKECYVKRGNSEMERERKRKMERERKKKQITLLSLPQYLQQRNYPIAHLFSLSTPVSLHW